ncbi:MAG: membrane-bound lytic murein transglycosylase MltF [Oceanicaulis sp.]
MKLIAFASAAGLVAACGGGGEDGAVTGEDARELSATGLAAIQERGELVVLTTRGPTTYQENPEGEPVGYEVDLTRALAEDLGVEVRFVVYEDLSGVLDGIAEGEGDIAAAGITRSEARIPEYPFGPAYKTVTEHVVTRRGGLEINSVEGLSGADLAVVAGSSYVESLEEIAEEVAGLDWRAVEAPSAFPLLEEVQSEALDATISDSDLLAHARLEFPELLSPVNLTEDDRSHAWILAPESGDLQDALDTWFTRAHDEGLLEDLDEKWYGHTTEAFDYVDVRRFIRRIEERLPRYQDAFKEAAAEHGLDWRWLAAQGYQESHWDPDAKSPTGVRGLMMLTLPTAGELGVEDRTDPFQSIEGGALYMARLLDRIPEGVEGQDRLFKAMAAYNVGLGHVRDARRLAVSQGLNEDEWTDVRRTLPLLSEPEYYKDLPYGYARGGEPVHYVRNIRRYKALLDLHLPPEPGEPLVDFDEANGEDVEEAETDAGAEDAAADAEETPGEG